MITSAGKKRLIPAIAAAAVVLMFLAFFAPNSEQGQRLHDATVEITSKVWNSGAEKTFYEIATKEGTDKVTDHSYQDMYEKYLPAIRHKKIKMLEIGLGCNMPYGPGKSYYTWLEYFPNVELYFMEYDAICAKEWAHKITSATIFPGDQGDPAVLKDFMEKYGRDFDIIIDDGGHTMIQQITSLQHLWKAIKPGGIYFCEDLQTSFMGMFGGGPRGQQDTMMNFIHNLPDDIMIPQEQRSVEFEEVESMIHIDCSKEMCAFLKRQV